MFSLVNPYLCYGSRHASHTSGSHNHGGTSGLDSNHHRPPTVDVGHQPPAGGPRSSTLGARRSSGAPAVRPTGFWEHPDFAHDFCAGDLGGSHGKRLVWGAIAVCSTALVGGTDHGWLLQLKAGACQSIRSASRTPCHRCPHSPPSCSGFPKRLASTCMSAVAPYPPFSQGERVTPCPSTTSSPSPSTRVRRTRSVGSTSASSSSTVNRRGRLTRCG